jgi:arylsulfatase
MAALKGQEWELFDLSVDRTEIHNLASRFPEKVKAMNALWEEWAADMNGSKSKYN